MLPLQGSQISSSEKSGEMEASTEDGVLPQAEVNAPLPFDTPVQNELYLFVASGTEFSPGVGQVGGPQAPEVLLWLQVLAS